MPVECELPRQSLVQEVFSELDYRIMGFVFDMHNELGRFLKEKIYQAELQRRCRDAGLEAVREVEVRVRHRSFEKRYYLDLVIEAGAVYELKTVEALNDRHRAQLINYLMLTGLRHGKLVNLGEGSVASKFVSTTLTPAERQDFTLDTASWWALAPAGDKLCALVSDMLADWGAFLAADLYREALVHLLGGPEQLLATVDIAAGGQVLGQQKVLLLAPGVVLHISSLSEPTTTYRRHVEAFLKHTSMRAVQWLNFGSGVVSLMTIEK